MLNGLRECQNEENTNLNELIEKKDIKIEKLEKEIDSLKEVVNEGNEQLTNEYSNKIIIAEQEINRLKESLTIKNDIAEKYFKENENLKDAVKKLVEVLQQIIKLFTILITKIQQNTCYLYTTYIKM